MTAKLPRQAPKPSQSWPAYRIAFTAAITAVLLAFILIGAGYAQKALQNPPTAAIASPGELVDQAWAIPGAILLTPHRDLVEMGIYEVASGWAEIHLFSPTIAVSTRKGWCLWPLGKFGVHVNGGDVATNRWNGASIAISPTVFDHIAGMVDSFHGYQSAFDRFKACVDEGSAKPITGAGLPPGSYMIGTPKNFRCSIGGKPCKDMPLGLTPTSKPDSNNFFGVTGCETIYTDQRPPTPCGATKPVCDESNPGTKCGDPAPERVK
jgi:hypothetical protein